MYVFAIRLQIIRSLSPHYLREAPESAERHVSIYRREACTGAFIAAARGARGRARAGGGTPARAAGLTVS